MDGQRTARRERAPRRQRGQRRRRAGDRHPPQGRIPSRRRPLASSMCTSQAMGEQLHGTNPAGRVCLLLHLTPVDEGHADGPVAHLQVARETRLTPTAASCPARRRCVPGTSHGRAVRARDREVPLRYSSPMWTGSVPAVRHPTSRSTPVATARQPPPGGEHRLQARPRRTQPRNQRRRRQANHRTQTAYAGTLPGHSAGRPCATSMSRHVGAVVHGAGEVAAVPGRLAMALRPTTQRMARQ